ncbi:MAG: thioredoxin [Bacteroidia bacterium]|nr:thioredoxin [Bacteroidia bacterium]
MKGSDQVDDSNVIHLDDKNFSNTVKSGLILVDFWAPWCGPCKVVGPIVADLANKYEGKAKVGKLNVDENQATATKYGIRSIPTLMIFKDGKPVEQLVGVRPKQALEKLIDKHLA